MPRLLIVHHSQSRSMHALTQAIIAGARDPLIEGVEVVVRAALEATANDVLAADGYVLGSTANFGYMAGAMKHFFDVTFLDVGGQLDEQGAADDKAQGTTAKRPFGLYVHGRYDTTGAVRSVLAITGALGWKQSAAVLEVLGDVDATVTEAAYELGGTIAAQLMTSSAEAFGRRSGTPNGWDGTL